MNNRDWMPRGHELRHKLAVLIFTVLTGRLENTRGQKGSWTEIQSAIIP
ncbi:MAG: hypothetical protein LBJ17_07705 [Dysgonamonadaceae bacterium]|jgi:hypothetical protein|nr:hypothetical protein [Dysgonamonadaceae bacterium]